MAVAQRAGSDPHFDAEVKTSERTRHYVRRIALINGAFLVLLALVTLLAYLRIGDLPDLEGQQVSMSRLDVELMHFKGYRVGQVIKDSLGTSRGCSWFTSNACSLPIAVRGNGSVYRCHIDRDRAGLCGNVYTCKPKKC